MTPSVGLYHFLRRGLFLLPPEPAHTLALAAIGTGAFADHQPEDPVLGVDVWGKRLRNPLGLAAGFDKNATRLRPLSEMGFGFMEMGGVTPLPQTGNARPRIFRETKARAIINRCGLNNDGLEAFAQRLAAYRPSAGQGGPPIAVNLGPNANSADPIADYAILAEKLAPLSDLLVVNVSSPNTSGLRDLQAVEQLAEILDRVESVIEEDNRPKLGIKLTSDMPPESLEALADFAVSRKLDGVGLTNTTVTRPIGLSPVFADEKGGLSGAPLKPLALEALRRVAGITKGQVPLIGIGGIETGEDAYRRIRAGASLLQIYSVLVFDGPGVIRKIKRDLADRLRADGFENVNQAIGADI